MKITTGQGRDGSGGLLSPPTGTEATPIAKDARFAKRVDPLAELAPDRSATGGSAEPLSPEQAESLRDACLVLAQTARDAFREACTATNPDQADACLAAAKDALERLWAYAPLRARPFRDLLGLLEAALKRTELSQLTTTQRDVLRQAFSALPRWILDDETVEDFIDKFADHEIDITGPLRPMTPKRVRVIFQPIE